MVSARSLFHEIRADDGAFQFLVSVAAKGELQGGWENERIAALTADPALAARIRRPRSRAGRLTAARRGRSGEGGQIRLVPARRSARLARRFTPRSRSCPQPIPNTRS